MLPSVVLFVLGAVIAGWSGEVVQNIRPWVWQIIIGLILVGSGVWFFGLGCGRPHTLIKRLLFHAGWVSIGISIVTLLNFNSYERIFVATGAWPLYLSGGLIMFGAALVLMFACTDMDDVAYRERDDNPEPSYPMTF
jgi:hypothetical protein